MAHVNTPAAIELCNILSTYEMEGLILAHDRIATTTDRTPASIISSPILDNSFTTTSKNNNNNQNANIVNNNVLKVEYFIR